MTPHRRALRALLVALLLPGLLLPGGLSLLVCICSEDEGPGHAAIEIASCCSAERSNQERRPAVDEGCGDSCDDCYVFQTQDREAATSSRSSFEIDDLAAAPADTLAHAASPSLARAARRPAAVSPCPPNDRLRLPLRI